uniref:Uncharacterized protein n=1 Tax=Oryza punctata TaxID=4537 RepID=A0A0E0MM74_ORYPU
MAGQRRCPWRWHRHGEKGDSEEEGKQGQGRRKVLTLWQSCSGTPRAVDDVDDRLMVHSRLAVRPHAKCSTTVGEGRSLQCG